MVPHHLFFIYFRAAPSTKPSSHTDAVLLLQITPASVPVFALVLDTKFLVHWCVGGLLAAVQYGKIQLGSVTSRVSPSVNIFNKNNSSRHKRTASSLFMVTRVLLLLCMQPLSRSYRTAACASSSLS